MWLNPWLNLSCENNQFIPSSFHHWNHGHCVHVRSLLWKWSIFICLPFTINSFVSSSIIPMIKEVKEWGFTCFFLVFCFYIYKYVSWTGDKALRELQEANISQQCFPILLECATKVSWVSDFSFIYWVLIVFSFCWNLFVFCLRQSKLLQIWSRLKHI